MIKPHPLRAVFSTLAVLAVVAATLTVSLASSSPAKAANGANFDPGNIISDANMYNSGTMNTAQLQAFIVAKGTDCTNNGSIPCLKNLRVNIPSIAANSQCSGVGASSNNTAGDAIVIVAKACGINPQVLLVLIEKEQTLVSTSKPSSWMYAEAAGFACPDTAPCSETYSGFFSQVYAAAKQFNIYRQYPSSFNYQAGRVNNIQYNPNTACGTKAVYIDNVATASLYDYTPYVPNAAALANMYGTGDSCSAYGNRNFWRIYTDWFGDPTGHALQCPSFEGCTAPWHRIGSSDWAQYSNVMAQSGGGYLAMVPHEAGASVYQDVDVPVTAYSVYQAQIWVKALNSGATAAGTFALWGLGQTATQSAKQNFSAGTSWTKLTVNLQSTGAHPTLRLQVYLTNPGVQVLLDTASLTQLAQKQAMAGQMPVQSPSFESGSAGWNRNNGFVNLTTYKGGAEAGLAYMATNTPAPGHSVSQDIAIPGAPAMGYTATIWVRSAKPFSGQLALWGLGGSSLTKGSESFTATTTWQPVTVTYQPGAINPTTLRLEIYELTVGPDLNVDDVSMIPNLLTTPSFEGTASGWSHYETQTNLVSYSGSTAGVTPVEGTFVGATNTSTPNGSIYTDTARILTSGVTYNSSIWLRTQNPSQKLTGKLVLWELGAGNTNSSTSITVTGTWQKFTVSKTIQDSASSTLRLQFYETTPNVTVFMDSGALH